MKIFVNFILIFIMLFLATCSYEKYEQQHHISQYDVNGVRIDFYRDGGLDSEDNTWLSGIPFQDVTLGAAASCPAGIDLSDKFPKPRQQFNASCVCYALAYYATYLVGRRYKDRLTQEDLGKPGIIRDPNYICAQMNQRNKGKACNEVDVSLGTALDFLELNGMPSLAESAPTLTDIDDEEACNKNYPSMDNSGPTITDLHRIPATLESMAGNLCSQTPIIVGIRVPVGFPSVQASTTEIPYRLPASVEWDFTDHLLLVVGYEPEGSEYGGAEDREGAFKLLNSWGPLWGDQGYLWVDALDLITMIENIEGSEPIALVHEIAMEEACEAGLPAPSVAAHGQPGNGGVGGGFQFDFNGMAGASSYSGELGKSPFTDSDFNIALIDQQNSRVAEIITEEGSYQFRVRANKTGCPPGDWLYILQIFSI